MGINPYTLPHAVKVALGYAPAASKPRKPRGQGRTGIAKQRFVQAVREVSGGGTVVTIPLYTTTEANAKGHWRQKATRAKAQRTTTALFVQRLTRPGLPATVRMVRIGKRLLDSDNLAGSLKHVRDGIADVYGVDDGSPLYTWVCEQEIGIDYAVRIEILPSP